MAGPYRTKTVSRLLNTTVPSTAGAMYTNSTGNKVMITGMSLHNSHNNAVTVELWLVESAGSRSAANKIYKIDLAADETLQLNENFRPILEAGDAVHGQAGTASVIGIFIYGVEIETIV